MLMLQRSKFALTSILIFFISFSLGAQAAEKVYLVGAGVASLAAASYFIRDGGIPGNQITIIEQSNITGGALDGSGNPESGYSLRGGRMFTEEAYEATFDLLSFIPSLNDPEKTVKEEFFEYNKTFQSNSKARLVDKDGNIVDSSRLGLRLSDKLSLAKLMLLPEKIIGTRKIEDFFSPQFFTSNFWYLWATTFAFQPWHSAVELKRYAWRFFDEFPRLYNLGGVKRTPFNQYDSLVRPITRWLQDQGVHFLMNSRVTHFDFTPGERGKKRVEKIHYQDLKREMAEEIDLGKNDVVVATLGSMTESSDCGSMTRAPLLKGKRDGGAFTLWEDLAKEHSGFGKPSVFDDRIQESKWESFTVTLKDPAFFQFMEKFSGNKAGTGGLVTFKDSNWLMSIVLPKQPYFLNQPEGVYVFWGYSLYGDREGNFVRKKMSEATGEDILMEIFHHLKIEASAPDLLRDANCIPCMMPFITAQFLTRAPGDRPEVVPAGLSNMALTGQFVEIPNDTVFTVDYSVRSAQMAVYSLLGLEKKVTPIHRGYYQPQVLWQALRTMLK